MKSLKKIFIDMIPVVLGVLIALFINNWKESADEQRFLNSVMGSIKKEMEEDLVEIKDILPLQYALIDTVELYLENEDVSVLDCIMKTNGLKVIAIKNNSWWSFLNAKIEIIGYETISNLGDVEATKQFINRKVNLLMDFALENAESKETSLKRMLIIQVLNLVDSEEGLVEIYEESLKESE